MSRPTLALALPLALPPTTIVILRSSAPVPRVITPSFASVWESSAESPPYQTKPEPAVFESALTMFACEITWTCPAAFPARELQEWPQLSMYE